MSSTPLLICGTLLVAMMAAGWSHYWSVGEFTALYAKTPSTQILTEPVPRPTLPRPVEPPPVQPQPLAQKTSPAQDAEREEFFRELLSEVKALRNENKNLIDQVAETNRDIMKMEFRLDTHSESFRPLPTSEERPDTSALQPDADFPGVLPPRATPVYLPDEE